MIKFEQKDSGFKIILVENRYAKASISLQGAHIFHYEIKGEDPLLWLSETTLFEEAQSIRGGIPICWPWFGMNKDTTLPQHGFARTSMWKYLGADESDRENTVLKLQLTDSKESLKLWAYKFKLLLTITIGKTLSLSLTTENCDKEAFEITEALHTYFNVSKIENIYVKGLDQNPYLNALTGKYLTQNGDIRVNQELDRIYQNVKSTISIVDKNRVVKITNKGSTSVVIWNPWIDKCARMSAMKDDAYKSMICIETANALEDKRIIQPNQKHTLTAKYEIQKRENND